MKRTLLIIALAVIAVSASAQPIKIGIKAGMSILSADVNSKDDVESKIKSKDVGFSLGAVTRFTIPLTGLYAQPEIVYNHARYKLTDTNGHTSTESYNNVEVPVLVGINILFIRINAGPVFNLRSFDHIKRPNVGYAAGAGLSFGRFDIDLRIQGYFSEKNKKFTLDSVKDDIKVTNKFYTISAAYFF